MGSLESWSSVRDWKKRRKKGIPWILLSLFLLVIHSGCEEPGDSECDSSSDEDGRAVFEYSSKIVENGELVSQLELLTN